jgi:hypothetical protein
MFVGWCDSSFVVLSLLEPSVVDFDYFHAPSFCDTGFMASGIAV